MAEQTITKLYNTFVKGLITEATELTYPPNASVAEDNCECFPKGNRMRRLGIDIEPGGYICNGDNILLSSLDACAIQEFVWPAVNQTDQNMLVTQFSDVLNFYDLSSSPITLAGGNNGLGLGQIIFAQPGSPPDYDFTAPFATDNQNAKTQVQMASGLGFLFVVSPTCEPFVVQYTEGGSPPFTAQKTIIQTRDFQGLDDGLSPEEEPSVLSTNHKYNLKNQGWNTPNTSQLPAMLLSFASL
jgi:hypothetical protein